MTLTFNGGVNSRGCPVCWDSDPSSLAVAVNERLSNSALRNSSSVARLSWSFREAFARWGSCSTTRLLAASFCSLSWMPMSYQMKWHRQHGQLKLSVIQHPQGKIDCAINGTDRGGEGGRERERRGKGCFGRKHRVCVCASYNSRGVELNHKWQQEGIELSYMKIGDDGTQILTDTCMSL